MGGCQLQFRVYQKPSFGTAIAFAEIANVFRAEFSVPYTAVCGTDSLGNQTRNGNQHERCQTNPSRCLVSPR